MIRPFSSRGSWSVKDLGNNAADVTAVVAVIADAGVASAPPRRGVPVVAVADADVDATMGAVVVGAIVEAVTLAVGVASSSTDIRSSEACGAANTDEQADMSSAAPSIATARQVGLRDPVWGGAALVTAPVCALAPVRATVGFVFCSFIFIQSLRRPLSASAHFLHDACVTSIACSAQLSLYTAYATSECLRFCPRSCSHLCSLLIWLRLRSYCTCGADPADPVAAPIVDPAFAGVGAGAGTCLSS